MLTAERCARARPSWGRRVRRRVRRLRPRRRSDRRALHLGRGDRHHRAAGADDASSRSARRLLLRRLRRSALRATEEGEFLVGLVSRGRSDVERDCGDGGVLHVAVGLSPLDRGHRGQSVRTLQAMGPSEVSFLAEGADPVSVPKGGHFVEPDSCAAASTDAGERSPVSALASVAGFVLVRRRLSPVSPGLGSAHR